METGIYVRVSTEEQAQEGFSIRAQEQKLKDYARIKEWSIFNIYIDEGISGKNITERPAINNLITDIKDGHVKNVVVFKIDRLTRSTGDLVYLIDLFNEHDCAFNSLSESIDTQTPSGRMFIKIIGIFAEFERENIAERVKLGCERKVREGYSLCGTKISYGYDRPKGQKIQTINEEEAVIVRQIFDWYVNQNMSIRGISKRINLMKIPTKYNAIWTPSTVKTVLTNCNYVGRVRYHMDDKENGLEFDGLHEAIITEELYNQAQKIIAKNKTITSTKKPRTENYFIGFIHCPNCGTRLQTHGRYYKGVDSVTKYSGSYRCPHKHVNNCGFTDIPQDKIEQAFIEYTHGIADFEEVDEIQLEEQNNQINKTQELIQVYQGKLNQLDLREKEVLDLYLDGSVDFEHYRGIKDRIDKDKKEVHSELKKLSITDDSQPECSQEDFVLTFKDNWEHLTNMEKRQFLMTFVKRIHISIQRVKNKRKWAVTVENIELA